jgi:hypothetical protein
VGGKQNLVALMGIGLILVNLLFSWQKEVLLKGSWN